MRLIGGRVWPLRARCNKIVFYFTTHAHLLLHPGSENQQGAERMGVEESKRKENLLMKAVGM